jgi:hypothetical protein
MKIKDLIELLKTFDPEEPVANVLWLKEDIRTACEMLDIDFNSFSSEEIELILEDISNSDLTTEDWNVVHDKIEEIYSQKS